VWGLGHHTASGGLGGERGLLDLTPYGPWAAVLLVELAYPSYRSDYRELALIVFMTPVLSLTTVGRSALTHSLPIRCGTNGRMADGGQKKTRGGRLRRIDNVPKLLAAKQDRINNESPGVDQSLEDRCVNPFGVTSRVIVAPEGLLSHQIHVSKNTFEMPARH